MGWSFRVGRLAGIDIFVHFTFLILLGVIGLSGYVSTGEVGGALHGVLLIGTVFFIVVLHELGHALAARYYGIKTKDITLLPIGGLARLERIPEKPVQELVVALAGPAVNVALAGLLWAVALVHVVIDPQAALTVGGDFVLQLFWINVFLAAFNMLPAFPMDGGRVLRALLTLGVGRTRATRVAARVGQGMAILFALVGLFVPGMIMLLLIALFVWMGAAAELAAVRYRAGLEGVPVGRAMARRFATVAPDAPIGLVAHHALYGFQRDFPVTVDGELVGMLTREDLRHALTDRGPDTRVAEVMRRDFPTVGPEESAESGLARLTEEMPVLPVLYRGQLVGLLTPEHLAEYAWRHRPAGREVARV